MMKNNEMIKKLKELREKLGIDENDKKTGGGLYEELSRVKAENEKIVKANLEATKKAPESDDIQEIYEVNVPGGETKFVNFYQLNNLIIQVQTYFSYLENPFLDGDGHSDQEKRELVGSILGMKADDPNLPITPRNISEANDTHEDKEWEYKEPGKVSGIIEPTVGSYEWFRRWWNFHKRYRETCVSYGTKEDYEVKDNNGNEKYPVLLEQESERFGTKNTSRYRDIPKFLEENIHNKTRAEKYLFTGEPLLLNHWEPELQPKLNRTTSYGRCCFSNDFLYFFDKVFNKSNLNSNLLLKADSKHFIGGQWEDKYYSGLNFNYYVPKANYNPELDAESGWKAKNFEVKGVKGDEALSQNYFNLDKENPPYQFKNITPGICGFIDAVHTVFDSKLPNFPGDRTMKKEFYRSRTLLSCSKTEGSFYGKPSELLSNNKLSYFGGDDRYKGKLSRLYEIQQEIDETKVEIERIVSQTQQQALQLEKDRGSSDFPGGSSSNK